MAKALEGLRVLDFTQVLAGPFCAQQLALLGADVVKIEPPDGGDRMRSRVLPSRLADVGMAAAFLTMNMSKRSLALDLKAPRGREIALALVRGADAMVHNFRAGVVDRLGLDYASARAANPSIVYTAITGFGSAGPRAGDAAYDGAVQAASGMMANNGTPETGPLRTGYFPVDMMTGMSAAFATTAALLRRERGGGGQMVDVAMLDCAVALQAAGFARAAIDGTPDLRIGNRSAAGAPTADSFPAADGALMAAAVMPNHVRAFLEEAGIAHMLDDPRFATPEARIANEVPLRAAIVAALAADTAANWEKRLAARGVPVARIASVAEAAQAEQLAHRGVLAVAPRPRGVKEDLRLVGAPYTASEDGPEAALPPPALGEHSREVLAEIGIAGAEFDALVAEGAVREAAP